MVKFMSGCFKHFSNQTTFRSFRVGFAAKTAVVVVVLWCIPYLRLGLKDSFIYVNPLTAFESDDEGSALKPDPHLFVGASLYLGRFASLNH